MQGFYKHDKDISTSAILRIKLKKNYDHTVVWGKNCRSKKGIKQCLGGLKCIENTKKNKKRLKVSFRAIFNAHFINLVSKEYFSYKVL